VKGNFYRRKADLFLSKTDPDASPMKRKGADHSHLGYQAHCVVDGGKARIILGVLVSPFEVTENKPMLDMLWRSAFRWKSRPRRVSGDSAYGTVENIAAIEKAGIRAYMALKGAGQGRPFFGKDEFSYDPNQDLYTCPSGELLMPRTRNVARSLIGYRAKPATCERCSLRPDCTTSKTGRQILRHFDEEYVDRVKGYRGTFPYEKALRKRRVWVEPLFAEAKDWHGLRRFRLRRLEKVNIEALQIAAGQNIKRLVAARNRAPRKLAQVAALRPPDRVSGCRPHLTGGFLHSSGQRRISTAWQAQDRCCVISWRREPARAGALWLDQGPTTRMGAGATARVAQCVEVLSVSRRAPSGRAAPGAQGRRSRLFRRSFRL
jgi:Transposase DDE domain